MSDPRVRLELGDVTALAVDAIVNAANKRMLGGGGVDGAIHRAAGSRLRDACRAVPEVRPGVRCPTGEARITPGFDLRARHVIHTVGPIWSGGSRGEAKALASCYRSALDLAAEHGLRTIAFPAISCGVFGYPIEAACRIAVEAVRDGLTRHPEIASVRLVAFGDEVRWSLEAALAATCMEDRDPHKPDASP